jgi:type II secretion system protein C
MVSWSRVMEDAPRWVSVILTSFIAVDLVHVGLPLIRPHPAISSPTATVTPREHGRHRAPTVDVQSIVAAHLFGTVAEGLNLSVADARQSTADLQLCATIFRGDPNAGVAIVSFEGRQKLYKVGDDVGGATLHSVYTARVFLNRDGRLEFLALPHSAVATVTFDGPRLPAGVLQPPAARADEPHVSDIFGADADVDPESQKLLGFRVSPNPPVSRFQSTGLHPQDLVTAVNGVPLTSGDPEHNQEVLNAALAASSATLSVIRQGQTMDVAVSAL